MDNLPITPRSRSAANRAGDSANDHMSGGRTEAKGKERIVDSPNINSEKLTTASVGNQGSGTSNSRKGVRMVGLGEEYLSPAEVRFLNASVSPSLAHLKDATASHTYGLGGGFTKVSAMETDRLEEILNSPSWRRGKSADIDVENPFLKEETELFEQDSVENGGSPSLSQARANGTAHITVKNAQLHLKPEACVFVANLDTSSTDAALTKAITEVFGKFGKVWIKIRRDPRGLPYAFCQYEDREIAEKAIREGHDTLILGRNCRTEQTKASRTAYLSRTDGKPIADSEANDVLARYGSLEKVWRSTETEKEIFRLHEGLWVKFTYYEHSRLAIRAFKDHKRYRLEEYFARGPTASVAGLPTLVTGARGAQAGYAEFMRGRVTGGLRTSIFIGNLDDAVGIPNIVGMFCVFGEIKEVVLVSKQTGAVEGYKTYAFVEYANPAGAERAVMHEGYTFNGAMLRVEYRLTSEHNAARVTNLRHAGSPNKRTFPSNGRQKNITTGVHGVHSNTRRVVTNLGRGAIAAAGALGPPNYYPINGIAYGNIGFANSNDTNGPTTVEYSQAGMIPAPMPGSIIGYNGQVLPSSTAFSPFATPYSQVGNAGSAWTYPPSCSYHGHGVHPATRNDH